MYTFLPSLLIVQAIAWLASYPHHDNYSYSLNLVAFMSIGIQIAAFIPASGLLGNPPTEKYYDATGAVTYASLVFLCIYCRGGWSLMSLRQKILSACVLIWCTRLGYFLYSRIRRHGGVDFRFAKVKSNFNRFATFWGVQGVWVFLTALPVYIVNDSVDSGPSSLTPRDYMGLSLWVLGFLIESIADYQKMVFSSRKENKWTKKYITTGLWSVSRHPNYFGEICLWIGVLVCASSSFTRPGHWLGVVSPVFVAFLLIFVSGIPLLEKSANEKFRDDPVYQAYKARVPVLIPFVGRKGDAAF